MYGRFDNVISLTEFILKKRDELAEIRNNRIVLSKHTNDTLNEFQICAEKMNANIEEKALEI